MISRLRLNPYFPTGTLVFFSATVLPAAVLRVLPAPSVDLFSYGLGLSDGGTVSGCFTDFDTPTPVLWAKTATGYAAPASAPLLSGGIAGEARWISSNGALAAGYVAFPTADFPQNFAPVLWSRTTTGSYTVAALPRLAASPSEGIVAAASASGTRLAGVDGASEAATVWRGTPGSAYVAQALPLPSGTSYPSFATSASADGAWLAGRATTTDGSLQAVVWNEVSGVYSARALQLPAGASQCFADVLSGDGTLVAGISATSDLYIATKWEARTGAATVLGTLANTDTAALAISADKLWIGGRATDRGNLAQTAVLWDAQGKIFTLASLAAAVDFGSFVPGDVSSITLVSPGVYNVAGTGTTLGVGQTQAYVIENLTLSGSASVSLPGTSTPTDTTSTTPTTPTTTTPTTSTGTPADTSGSTTTTSPSTSTGTTTGTTTTTALADLLAATPTFDPAASGARTLVGDTFAAIFDPARASVWRFSSDQASLRPLRTTFAGTSRDALSFDGTRVLSGPLAQNLFAPGVAQDMAFVGLVRIPATGGSGKAVLLAINYAAAEPALALGYDYAQGRFYASFLQAFNGAPSEMSGAASTRDATHVVRLQKSGGTVSLYVDGALLAQTTSARPVILNVGQGAPLGLGGVRALSPQFVGQLGRFHLRNTALSATEAAALESDLRTTWLGGTATSDTSSTSTPTTTTPTTTTPTPSTPTTSTPTTTTPTTATPTTTTTASGVSLLAAAFDPAAPTASTIVGGAYAALSDPTRSNWRFASDQAAVRPLRATFPGTSRDSLSFDGTRMLPGPRSSDLFTPGVAQDAGLVAAVRIPATGGSGRATLFTVNLSDTEPALGVGYDYSAGQFFAYYTQAFNGAPSVLAGGSAPRGATYLVRLQKTGGNLRLLVNGSLVAQTNSARPAILASGQNGYLGLGGIRVLNTQFVGQIGKFYLRNSALTDADALALEADARAWFTP